jgi:microcystin-dependent protein
MTRPTLQNGDIFADTLANAAGYPILDGSDEYGHGPKVVNDWLDDGSDQIKAQFYGFYNRIKLTIGTGLTLNYSGAPILKSDGTLVTLAPGQVFLPDNSTTFIYIDSDGQVAQANTLPKECIPLGIAVTSSGAVTQLTDLRNQVIEQVKPLSLPPATSPFLVGDVKETFRTKLEPGFLWCDGARYSNADYPDLFAVLGTTHNLVGDPAGTFRVPDKRGRSPVGAGTGTGLTNRALGSRFGNEQAVLATNQMPSHSHSINDLGHSHILNDPGHSHTVSDVGHSHQVFDPGHNHTTTFQMGGRGDSIGTVFTNSDQSEGVDLINTVATAVSGANVSIGTSGSNISIQNRTTGITVSSTNSGITINQTGGSTPVNLMQPSIAVNFMIRCI